MAISRFYTIRILYHDAHRLQYATTYDEGKDLYVDSLQFLSTKMIFFYIGTVHGTLVGISEKCDLHLHLKILHFNPLVI